jgi:hypothetical protein
MSSTVRNLSNVVFYELDGTMATNGMLVHMDNEANFFVPKKRLVLPEEDFVFFAARSGYGSVGIRNTEGVEERFKFDLSQPGCEHLVKDELAPWGPVDTSVPLVPVVVIQGIPAPDKTIDEVGGANPDDAGRGAGPVGPDNPAKLSEGLSGLKRASLQGRHHRVFVGDRSYLIWGLSVTDCGGYVGSRAHYKDLEYLIGTKDPPDINHVSGDHQVSRQTRADLIASGFTFRVH